MNTLGAVEKERVKSKEHGVAVGYSEGGQTTLKESKELRTYCLVSHNPEVNTVELKEKMNTAFFFFFAFITIQDLKKLTPNSEDAEII